MKKTLAAVKNKNGFTLVELLVVLLLMAILSAMAATAYKGYVRKQDEKAAIEDCRRVVTCANVKASDLFYNGFNIMQSDSDSTSSVLMTESNAAEILLNASAAGTLLDIRIAQDAAVVRRLIYQTEDGIVIVYDRDEIAGKIYSVQQDEE